MATARATAKGRRELGVFQQLTQSWHGVLIVSPRCPTGYRTAAKTFLMFLYIYCEKTIIIFFYVAFLAYRHVL